MKKFILLLLIVHCTLNIEDCVCQWQWVNPLPNSFSVKYLKFADANTVYMTQAYGIVMKSTNKGVDWFRVYYDSTANTGPVYFLDANTGFVAYCKESKIRVIKTTNGGSSWNSVILASTYYTPLSLFFLNSNTGYVGSLGSILFRTTNGGNSWDSTVISTDTTFYINGIYFKNANSGIAIGWYGTSQNQYYGRIFKTTNGGINWTYTVPPAMTYSMDFINDTGFVFCGYSFLKTLNFGANWSLVSLNINQSTQAAKFINSQTGFVVGRNAYPAMNVSISKTTNGGTNWQSSFPLGDFDLSAVDGYGTNDFITGGMYGTIVRTTNTGLNWISNCFSVDGYYCVSFPNSSTGFLMSSNCYYKTTNSGINWIKDSIPYSYNLNLSNYSAQFIDAQTGFIMKDSLYKTTNGGQNWSKIIYNNNGRINSFYFINANTGLAVLYYNISGITFEYLEKTTNGGQSWQETLYQNFVDINKMYFVDENTGYSVALSGGASYKKTTNGGLNWTTINVGYYFNKIYFLNPTRHYLFGDIGLYVTTNGGASFNRVFLDSSKFVSDVSFIDDNTGYLLNSDYYENTCPKIYKTTNGGLNWNQSCLLFRNSGFNLIKFLNSNTGFCFGNAGSIIKTTNGGGFVEVVQISTYTPSEFGLFQNYPNPFNPNTIIRFQIKDSRHGGSSTDVKLIVYNILGKEIVTLVNEKQSPGVYEVKFDGSMLPSGVYFYKLITGDFTEVKKMLLIK